MMTASQEWRRGWRVVLAAAVGYATAFSTWQFTSSLFVPELQRAFGWSRGQIALSSNGMILAAVLAPFIGRLADRLGVRRVAIGASVMFGLGSLGLAAMNGSLWLYYALVAAIGVVGMGTTGMTFCRAVTSWFEVSRGRALAVTTLGLAVAGFVLPPLLFGVMSRFGWRAGYLLIAALPLLIGAPVSLLWLRERPGAGTQDQGGPAAASGFGEIFRAWRVPVVCLAGALTYAPFSGIIGQLQPMLVDGGLQPAAGARIIGLTAIAALTGTLVSGWLVDRIWAPLVACGFCLGPVAGCLLLMEPRLSVNAAGAAVILVGLAQGAEVQLIAFLIGRYFGARNYAAIFGLSVLTTTVMCAVANVSFGYAHDLQGNYRLALAGAAVAFAGAAGLYLALGRYPAAAQDASRAAAAA